MSATTTATLATALLIPLVLAIPGDVSVAGGDEPAAAAISTELAAEGGSAEASAPISPATPSAETADSMPLEQAMELLSKQHKVNIMLETSALAKAGINPKDEVRLTVSKSLSAALSEILDPLHLVAGISGDVIHVTTQERLIQSLQERQKFEALPDQVQDRLKQEVSFEFVNTSLYEVLDEIATTCRLELVIDRPALKRENVSYDTPVEMVVNGVQLRSLLNMVLKPLKLDYFLVEGVLTVTSRDNGNPQVAEAEAGGSSEEPADALNDNDMAGMAAPMMAETSGVNASQDVLTYDQHPENVQRILAELDRPTQVEFVDTPLQDAVEFIAQHHNITILMDTQAMTDVGIATDEPVNLILRNVTLRSILHHLLRPKGLTTVVEDEVLKVTTKEIADDQFETRIYNTQNLGNLQSEKLIKVLEDGTVGTSWTHNNALGVSVGGTANAIDGGLVIKQTQSGHEQVANLLSQLRRKHLAEQQQGVAQGMPGMGMGAMMGGGFGGGGMGMGGGMGAGGGGGASGMGAGAMGGMMEMMRQPANQQPPAQPNRSAERSQADETTPRLVIYDVGDLAESLIPKPEQTDEGTAGGGLGGGGGVNYSAILTILEIIQMGAQKSDMPFSSQQLPDGTIAVMSTPAGHRIVEETLETLREHAKQPRTGGGFGVPGGGGFF